MFERYTESARRVIFFARYFAGRAGSLEIETEHLLLGLLREDQSLGKRFLGSPWAAEGVWRKIQQSKPAREKISGTVDMPLSSESKRVLTCAAEEAVVLHRATYTRSHMTDISGIPGLLPTKRIRTEHILLGLLREEKCFAGQILDELGVHLVETRTALMQVPHNDAANEEFSRERDSRPEDIVELQGRIQAIRHRIEEAIGKHDFATAKMCSEEEGKERDKLFLLYQKYGLLDWIYG